MFAKVFKVCYQCGHSRNEALLSCDGANFADGIHGVIRRSRCIKKYCNKSCVAGVEFVIKLFRQKLHRNGNIHERTVPKNRFHVLDGFELFNEICNILARHIFNHYKGKRAFAEVVKEFVLTDYGVHILRKVIKHIIIYPCVYHSEN